MTSFGIFFVNFEHISLFFSIVSLADFEKIYACWDSQNADQALIIPFK